MTDPFRDIPSDIKHIIDLTAIVTMLGALVEFLPAIAALLTIVWTAIRIWETETVGKIIGRKPDGDKT